MFLKRGSTIPLPPSDECLRDRGTSQALEEKVDMNLAPRCSCEIAQFSVIQKAFKFCLAAVLVSVERMQRLDCNHKTSNII